MEKFTRTGRKKSSQNWPKSRKKLEEVKLRRCRRWQLLKSLTFSKKPHHSPASRVSSRKVRINIHCCLKLELLITLRMHVISLFIGNKTNFRFIISATWTTASEVTFFISFDYHICYTICHATHGEHKNNKFLKLQKLWVKAFRLTISSRLPQSFPERDLSWTEQPLLSVNLDQSFRSWFTLNLWTDDK